MERFLLQGPNKRLCKDDLRRSPRKVIKLEEDEGIKEDDEFSHPVPWQKIEAEGLDCDYALLFPKEEADDLFKLLEKEVVYSSGTK